MIEKETLIGSTIRDIAPPGPSRSGYLLALWAAALLLVLVGGYLRLNELERVPYLADEPEDMMILWTLQQEPNPFTSLPPELRPALDQARLPYYLTGMALALSGRDDLLAARYVSVAAAMGTILLLFLLGARLFGPGAGLLAAAMQAFSIYDLGFSRLAMTSSPSLLCFFFLLALYGWVRGMQEDRVGWLALAAAAAGWAAGAKFFGLLVLPALLLVPPAVMRRDRGEGASALLPFLATWLLPTGAALALFSLLALLQLPPLLELALFAAAALLGLAGEFRALRRYGWREVRQLDRNGLALLLLLTAGFHLFLATPFHLDAGRLAGIFGVFPRWHTGPLAQTGVLDLFVVLLVRLSIPFAPLLLAALVFYARQWRERGRRLVLIAFLLPLCVLSLFPFKVTWYPMMVLPLAYLMIGDYLAGWMKAFRRRGVGRDALALPAARAAGWAAAVLLVLTTGWYASHAASLHPWYELDGYQLGPGMVGWSRPAMLSYEGLPAALEWLEANLPKDAAVACHFVDIPRYNRYAVEFLRWYARRPNLRFRRADTVEKAAASPRVITTFYSRSAHGRLREAGYHTVRIFRVLDLEYGRLWSRQRCGSGQDRGMQTGSAVPVRGSHVRDRCR